MTPTAPALDLLLAAEATRDEARHAMAMQRSYLALADEAEARGNLYAERQFVSRANAFEADAIRLDAKAAELERAASRQTAGAR